MQSGSGITAAMQRRAWQAAQKEGNRKIQETAAVNPRYLLRIDCWEAEKGLKTTPDSECALISLAIDEPLEYAHPYLEGNMQMWVDAEDSLELW